MRGALSVLGALAVTCLGACSGGGGEEQDAGDAGNPVDSSPLDVVTDSSTTNDVTSGFTGLHVVGNAIHDKNDKVVRLLGVNHSGTEYSCVQGNGIFEGPVDDAAIATIAGWTANVIRIPLNEDCWLAINGVPANASGAAYKQAISDYVDRILARGMYAIVELHWSAPGTTQATKQVPMPDKDHAIDFWKDVAATFANRGDVIFELFNEPYPDNNQDSSAAWTCWQSGGTCPGITYQAAGMQDLLSAVRQAGAHNLVLLGGIEYSNSLTQWVAHAPSDPDKNIAAAWHVYNFNGCSSPSCYDQYAGVVAQSFPIVTTEIGEDDCSGQFITTLMTWLDSKQQNYLGWVWNTWGGCLVLINDYNGTAAGTYGQTFKTHIASVPH